MDIEFNSNQKNSRRIIISLVIFLIGFISAILIQPYININVEQPLSSWSYFSAEKNNAPSDFIKENNIEVYQDKIIIRIANTSLSSYASTGSMLPLFDKGANGIRIIPKSEEEINLGDIITFEKDAILIVHRVIEKGQDSEGIYFVTKGYNNSYSDEKIRFADIKYKTIGILY